MKLNEIEKWQEKLGIAYDMSKEEALKKFREWQGQKKTCQRCQEKEFQYRDYCPIKLICEEAESGKPKDRPIILRKESRRSIRDLKIDSLRTSPKRSALG